MLTLQRMAFTPLLTTFIFRNVQERFNHEWPVMNSDKGLIQYVM